MLFHFPSNFYIYRQYFNQQSNYKAAFLKCTLLLFKIATFWLKMYSDEQVNKVKSYKHVIILWWKLLNIIRFIFTDWLHPFWVIQSGKWTNWNSNQYSTLNHENNCVECATTLKKTCLHFDVIHSQQTQIIWHKRCVPYFTFVSHTFISFKHFFSCKSRKRILYCLRIHTFWHWAIVPQ